VTCAELPVLAPVRPWPGRIPAASAGLTPGTCTGAPAATANASRISPAGGGADAGPSVPSVAPVFPAAAISPAAISPAAGISLTAWAAQPPSASP